MITVDFRFGAAIVGNIDDQRDFVEAWYQIDGHEIVEPEPWDSFRSADTNEYLILRDAILPALVRTLIAQRTPESSIAWQQIQVASP